MSAAWGALLGAVAGSGLLLCVDHAWGARRRQFERRVLAHLPDLVPPTASSGPTSQGPWRAMVTPLVAAAAARLDVLVGGSASVQRRIQRGDLDLTVRQFRAQQVTWGLAAFAVGGVLALLVAWRSPDRTVPMVVLAVLAGIGGVLARDSRLTAQVRRHEQRVLEELPAVAELLALSVAAGEGVVAALDRVTVRSRGALSRVLAGVLAEVRTGTPVTVALDGLSQRTGLPVVARFTAGIAVAVERGTPLADVLHAQAGDVREARRRALIESGARREVAMMVPVVFLVLPVTVMFAFWPGLVGLRLAT